MKLLILDWNGTAFNDKRVVYRSVKTIFETYGVKPPARKQYFEEITADFMKFYWKYGIPKTATGDDLNKIRKTYLEAHWNEAKLNKGLETLLDWCVYKLIRTAIVSAEVEEVLKKRMESFRLNIYLDRVKGSAWNKEEAFVEILDYFGVKAEEAVYVDDTFDGITAAKNVELKTIGFTKGYNSVSRIKLAEPDFMVSRLAQIVGMILEGAI